LAGVREGDLISIDTNERRLDLQVKSDEITRRLRDWRAPEPQYSTGALAKYARLVSSSARGAVCG
jgi:dihydroxy-acid dehydratase